MLELGLAKGAWRGWLVGAACCVVSASAAASEPAGVPAAPAPLLERGRSVYAERCAGCHDHPTGRTPHRAALLYRTPAAVARSLTQGAMQPMAAGIAADDIRALATFLTGRVPQDEPEPSPNRCREPGGPVAIGPGDWPTTGKDLANTRHQDDPGLDVAALPRLKLKWAFAQPGGATGPVAVAGGRIFLAVGTGDVFSLDARTGCAHWTFSTGQLVRSVTVATLSTGRSTVLFGDNRGFVTALDAQTGTKLWAAQVEEHPLSKVTAAPSFYGDRVYVPMSSIEDPLQHDPAYECCTSRGSVTALDAHTGKLLWKKYTIVEEPKPLPRTSTTGPQLSAPAGGAVFSPLTIDAKRKLVYAATGSSYDDGNWPDSHAIVAYDLATGERRWSRPFKPIDQVEACRKAGDSDCRNNFDFAAPVVLRSLPDGKQILVAGQKSGFAYGLDPDADGKVLWTTRVSRGTDLGGLMYGLAVDGTAALFPISDTPDSFTQPAIPPGGLVALDVRSGEILWRRAPEEAVCSWGNEFCLSASIAAATAIPGAVFQGTADGHVRAYSTSGGSPLWDFDTGRSFRAVNGIDATGGQVNGWPVVVVDGAVYVVSGASTQAKPGNALLVFSVDGR